MKHRALCFDMDGVLVDSEPLHIRLNQQVCGAHGMEVPLEAWRRFTGMQGIDIFSTVVVQYGGSGQPPLPAELVAEKRRLYVEHAANDLQPMPGVALFLAHASRVYEKISLTTSGSRAIQEKILERLGLLRHFNVIVTNDDIVHGKPNPEPYALTARLLDIPAGECVVIEDAVNGVFSARAAGCDVIGFTSSFSEDALLNAGAICCVSDYAQLRYLLLP